MLVNREWYASGLVASAVLLSAFAFVPEVRAQTEEPGEEESEAALDAADEEAPDASADAPSGGRTDDVVLVTATRRERSLQAVPVSVSAVTGDAIEERRIQNVDDLAASIPNLSVRPAIATKNTAIITIRGQVQRENLITADPTVGVYVDDVYLARAYSSLNELLDVERVEVLRGPQGTLFGRNTIGGAIRVITRKPDPHSERISGYVTAGMGDYGLFETSAAVDAPLVGGKLAMRYAGMFRTHDGYTNSILVSEPFLGPDSILEEIDTNDEEVTSHRLALAYEPTRALEILASYYVYNEKSNGVLVANIFGDISNIFGPGFTNQFNSPYREDDFFTALTNTAPFSEAETEAAIVSAQYNFGDTSFGSGVTSKLVVSYVDSENHSSTNADGVVTDSVTLLQFEPDLLQQQDQFSAELQFFGTSFNNHLDWIGGLYYFREQGHEFGPGTSRVFGDNSNAVTFTGDAQTISKSAFLNLDLKLTDRFGLSVGGRYTDDEKSIQGRNRIFVSQICVYAPGPGITTSVVPGGPCLLERTDQFDFFSWSAGANYQLTDSVYAYATVSTGYRSGGQQMRAVNFTSSEPFRPDEVISYEAGLKTRFGDRLQLNAAGFHVDYSDIQQSIILAPPLTPTTTTVVVNQGEASLNGFELEGVLNIVAGLSFEGAVGYTTIDFEAPDTVQIGSPEWNGAASLVYEREFNSIVFGARLDYSYSGDFFNTSNPNARGAKLDGSQLVDARLRLGFANGVELAVWGKNLLEEEYYVTAVNSGNVVGGVVGAPRTWGVSGRYSF